MKKSLLLLATVCTIVAVSPAFAQEGNSIRIAEIETQIKKLEAELKELKKDSALILGNLKRWQALLLP